MKIQLLKIGTIKPNPDNPRVIKDDDYTRLLKNITERSQFMYVNHLKLNEDLIVLAGNQRLAACKELKWKEVPCTIFTRKMADIMNQSAKKEKREQRTYKEYCNEIVIMDNTHAGEWDYEELEDWDQEDLEKWNVPMPNFGNLDEINKVNSANEEWIGMPDFEPVENPYKIIINFESEKERNKYANDHKMNFTKRESRAWSTWWPFKEREDLKSLKYEQSS